jgi:multiple sugar transport system ATP-binding protein
MANLSIQALSKSFGRTKALQDVSFEVHDGEFLVLLGPTAAGKTTTLRCVAGLEKLDNGKVMMDGTVVNTLSPAERDFAFVFQTYALYPRKTAYENMAFPLEARNLSKQAIDQRVKQVAEILHISELLNRRPAQMSGGQQQRVALGRAMVRQPRLFLMDEPLTNLDFKLRVEMRAELKRLQRELATSFFYVTNDQVEAMSMADRIAVLNKGILQQVDAPEVIYDRPANLFVAQFVGSPRINLMPCEYADGKLLGEGWALGISPAQSAGLNTGKAYILGARSEDITIHYSQRENTLATEVFVIEPLGDRSYVDVHLGNTMLKIRTDSDYTAKTGETIHIEFDKERLHLFEADTEKTIF